MANPASWVVYIIENGSKTALYVGITTDLPRRVLQHNGLGGAARTRAGRPWSLVYTEPAVDRGSALKREAHLKKLRRSVKLRLIAERSC